MDSAKASASLVFELARQNDIEAPFFGLSGLTATGCRRCIVRWRQALQGKANF
jgi:hypothetical protein